MKNTLWFRRKTYGWGWTPITWQGWTVTFVCVLIPILVKSLVKHLEYSKNIQNFALLATVPLVLVALIVICLRYGEKPHWQWGVKTTKLSHIDLNVSDYDKSIAFYDLILLSLGWEKLVSRNDYTAYSDGTLKIVLNPTDEKFKGEGFHRKRVGLNHLAFYAQTKEMVDQFHNEILVANDIATLYDKGPSGDKNYYSVYFEDPDRIKLEVVYAPFYCNKNYWPNTIGSDYESKEEK